MLTLLFLKSWWRELTIAILAILLYFSWHTGNNSETEVKQLTELITQYRQKLTDTRTTTTVVTKRPDGTTETKTIVQEKKTQEKSKITDKRDVTKTVTKDRYRITVYKNLFEQDYKVGLGARLGDTPLSAEVLGSSKDKSVSVGLGFSW